MRKNFWWIIYVLLILSCTVISWKAESNNRANKIESIPTSAKKRAKQLFSKHISEIYQAANLEQAGLDMGVFQKAVTGFYNLKAVGKISEYNSILTIIDLAKSSCQKRMWIVDLINNELILNTWVAHGSGSGDDMANRFSNANDSHASSLGFYTTDDVYNGKHGLSLRLDGLDEGFNNNARMRSIVIHAAPYVCEGTIAEMGRLGRSQGCPAVSPKVAGTVINTIKGKTVLFINGNEDDYVSKYLDENIAANYVYPISNADNTVNASL